MHSGSVSSLSPWEKWIVKKAQEELRSRHAQRKKLVRMYTLYMCTKLCHEIFLYTCTCSTLHGANFNACRSNKVRMQIFCLIANQSQLDYH